MTLDEIVAELEALQGRADDPDGFFTTEDVILATGMSSKRVHAGWKAAKRAGRLQTRRLTRENTAGAMCTVPGYRIVPE